MLPQIRVLIQDEPNLIANLANIAAALKEAFGFFWVGFYFVENEELVLGPFQGPVACTRIRYGKGVCGKAFAEAVTVIVPDVNQFPGHIACSAALTVGDCGAYNQKPTCANVLDIDSDRLNSFDVIDQQWLEALAAMIAAL